MSAPKPTPDGSPPAGATADPRSAILVRYGEVFLKGRNRKFFEQQLAKNVARALRGLPRHHVEVRHGRLLVFGPGGAEALRRIESVFGISSLSPATILEPELAVIEARALELGRAARDGGARSFRIASRRTDKSFHLTSPEVNARIGQIVKDETGLEVKLKDPDSTIGIEIGERRAFVYGETRRGPGGLPVGCGGRALLLLSGGIDSPSRGTSPRNEGS